MPDKKREEYFTKLFLGRYNSLTGKEYIIDCRPEDSKNIAGTYDFLCKEQNSKDDYLAIEEKSLNKSTENVRDNRETGNIIKEVNKILDKKGLFYNKNNDKIYLFWLEFKNAPKSKDKNEYVKKVVELVEQTISENVDVKGKIFLNTKGYDCIEEFSLSETRNGQDGEQKVNFGFVSESNLSKDIDGDALSVLKKIIDNSNSKLEMPKDKGRKTILLITNDYNNFVLVNEHNIQNAIQRIEEGKHQYIDEIFFINKQSSFVGDGYDIIKIGDSGLKM